MGISKYYVKTNMILTSINTIKNHCSEEKKNSSGRFRILKNLKSNTVAGVKILAEAVKLLAVGVFETITYPLNKHESKSKIKAQVTVDIQSLKACGSKKDTKALKNEIVSFIEKEGLFANKTQKQKEKYIERAMATYASSRNYYAPVVVEWVHSVLETSKAFQNDPSSLPRRVIFLARDGIPAYKVAQELIKKHPEKYGNIPVSLLYISRKVKDWAQESTDNKEMLLDYAKQEGVKEKEKCLVIDIGFFGSMIQPIKEILGEITEDLQFGYLISHTQNAYGFMGDLTEKLDSVIAAGQNRAVHWLEDTHQGVRNSATKLVKKENGKIKPHILNNKNDKTCKSVCEKSYLYKHFGMQAILDGEKEISLTTEYLSGKDTYQLKQWGKASEKSKVRFDKFLMKYFKGIRRPFSKHF